MSKQAGATSPQARPHTDTDMADQATATRKPLRTTQGIVTSAKAAKTLKVELAYQVKHPKYGKFMNRRTVLHVHDERGEAGEGDRVEVAECRPMSRTKHHRLVRIVEKAPEKLRSVADVESSEMLAESSAGQSAASA